MDSASLTQSLMVFLADYAVVLLFLVLPWLWLSGHKRLAWSALLSAGLAWLTGKFIKDFFYLPRPYVISGTVPITQHLLDGSLPSNHTAAAFALSFAIYAHRPRLGAGLLLVGLLIGISRIVAGVHYPLDILAGIVLGYMSAYLIKRFVKT